MIFNVAFSEKISAQIKKNSQQKPENAEVASRQKQEKQWAHAGGRKNSMANGIDKATSETIAIMRKVSIGCKPSDFERKASISSKSGGVERKVSVSSIPETETVERKSSVSSIPEIVVRKASVDGMPGGVETIKSRKTSINSAIDV